MLHVYKGTENTLIFFLLWYDHVYFLFVFFKIIFEKKNHFEWVGLKWLNQLGHKGEQILLKKDSKDKKNR